ncbi:aspartyl/asparaginyl beta-hydroxylase domain-containing protein [Haliangium sp.]|uniref:aspartyl/asparaginyl beta-hydroxylase domain-containing protein n=1 Tax=Haliangium sp. TaxID=2663208 RepID=UPI003D0FFF64
MDIATLLDGIRAGDQHQGGIRCLRLFRLDRDYFSALRDQVVRLCDREHPSDVSRPEHITNWTRPVGQVQQFSLLAGSGRYDDFSSDHDQSCLGKRFHGAAEYPLLGAFVAAFPHAINVRINLLGPGAGLSPHEEHALFRTRAGTIGARVRLHLPVVTTPAAELVLDGEVHHLDAGTIYYINHGCVHAAFNRGDSARIHLVWDLLLTHDVYRGVFAPTARLDLPLVRVDESERVPAPARVERMGAHRRLPSSLSGEHIDELGLCPIQ